MGRSTQGKYRNRTENYIDVDDETSSPESKASEVKSAFVVSNEGSVESKAAVIKKASQAQSTSTEEESKFVFRPAELAFESKDAILNLTKWGLTPHRVVKKFRYNHFWDGKQESQLRILLTDFFNSTAFKTQCPVCSKRNTSTNLSKVVTGVQFTPLKTTAVSLNALSMVYSANLASKDGNIMGCIEEDFEGTLLQDELRKVES